MASRSKKHAPHGPPPGEFGFIQWLLKQCPTNPLMTIPSGDDCAALRIPAGQEVLYAIDSVVDGVHFHRRKDGCRAAGRKAVLRNVSDIAAMGGAPIAAVAGLGLPDGFSARERAALFDGLASACREWGMALAGGDIARSPGGLWISVSILGMAPAGQALRRDTARVGDRIYVTGALGGSIHGKHLEFTPRVAEGLFLMRRNWATACMDLSDGLARDLANLCIASKVGAVVHAAALPVAPVLKKNRRLSDRARALHAVGDGEDFELLFTVNAKDEAKLLRAWPKKLAALTCVGEILPRRSGLTIEFSDGRRESLAGRGWEHRV